MEISSTTLAAREQFLNKAHVGQEILQRSLEKSEEAKQLQQQDKPQEVRKPEADKQGNTDGRINIYA